MVLDTQFSLTGDWEAQICELWQQQVLQQIAISTAADQCVKQVQVARALHATTLRANAQ
jgi:hypothetical protein